MNGSGPPQTPISGDMMIGVTLESPSRPTTARSGQGIMGFMKELDRLHEQQIMYTKKAASERKRKEKLDDEIKVSLSIDY